MRILNLTWRPRPVRVDGSFPLRRLFVTLLAPLALLVLGDVPLPLVNEYEFKHIMRTSDMTNVSVIALGVMPVLTSFALVELIALAVPRLRWRRHDPLGRIALGQAVAALAIVVALVQGFFLATYFESMAYTGLDLVDEPGWKFRILIMVSLAAGTLLLAVVAGMISVHGLGNGYGVMLVTSWLVPLGWRTYRDPGMWVDDLRFIHVVGLAAICFLARALLRVRVERDDGEAPMCLPSSSIAPLTDGGGLVYVVVTLTMLGFGNKLVTVMERVALLRENTILAFVVMVALVPFWAWVLSRPAVIARVAKAAKLAPPSRTMWLGAMVLSGALLASVFLIDAVVLRASPFPPGTGVMALLGTAVVLDMIDDARARRERLAPVAVLHQIQRAGIVERLLGDAKIRCHIHASNIRALYAFFAPWAPAVVLVPEADAGAARKLLDDVLREPRAPGSATRASAA